MLVIKQNYLLVIACFTKSSDITTLSGVEEERKSWLCECYEDIVYNTEVLFAAKSEAIPIFIITNTY